MNAEELAKHYPGEYVELVYVHHWKEDPRSPLEKEVDVGARGYISKIYHSFGLEGGFVVHPESLKNIPKQFHPPSGYDANQYISLGDIRAISHLTCPSYH